MIHTWLTPASKYSWIFRWTSNAVLLGLTTSIARSGTMSQTATLGTRRLYGQRACEMNATSGRRAGLWRRRYERSSPVTLGPVDAFWQTFPDVGSGYRR